MLTAKIEVDTPTIKGLITPPAYILGKIVRTVPEVKGAIVNDSPVIHCSIDVSKRESYYEVSNPYGTTIIIGD